MKEQEKNTLKTNETEINNLQDKKFKALVIRKVMRKRNTRITLKKIIKPQGKKLKKETRKNYKNCKKTSNKMEVSTYLLIITLNVNGLTIPVKRTRVVELNSNLQGNNFRPKYTQRLDVWGLKKIFQAN